MYEYVMSISCFIYRYKLELQSSKTREVSAIVVMKRIRLVRKCFS